MSDQPLPDPITIHPDLLGRCLRFIVMGGPLGKEMFYHRFRTSAELCKAGLFIEESQLPSKKHRRLKCSYF